MNYYVFDAHAYFESKFLTSCSVTARSTDRHFAKSGGVMWSLHSVIHSFIL